MFSSLLAYLPSLEAFSSVTQGPSEEEIFSLHLACFNNDISKVKSLVTSNNVNIPAASGWTPLHMACRYGDAEMVKLFLNNGAVINSSLPNVIEIKSKSFFGNTEMLPNYLGGWTPLHFASKPEIAELLLEHGADISARTSSGKTPSDVATKEVREVLFFHEIAQSKKNWLALIPNPNEEKTYILNKNSLNYYAKESSLSLRLKSLFVLASTPIFTVGVMLTHFVKIVTDVAQILFAKIEHSFKAIPDAIVDRLTRCVKSPFYALKMSFASVYGVYSVQEGRERMNQVAEDWEETALLNFTGLRKVANLKEAPMKGLPRLVLQKI